MGARVGESMSEQPIVYVAGHEGGTITAELRGEKLVRVSFTKPAYGVGVLEFPLPVPAAEVTGVEPVRPSVAVGRRLFVWSAKLRWEEVDLDSVVEKAREKLTLRAATAAEDNKRRRRSASSAAAEPTMTAVRVQP